MTIETVEHVVGLLNEYSVAEITLERGGERISVRRGATVFAPPPAAITEMTLPAETVNNPSVLIAPPETEPIILGAPMVGVFHHLPTPPRYGVAVGAGQLVGHIESMKLMNDVLSDQAGQVVEVLVEDGGAVEYGQPLFRLAPSDAKP